ncbi:MAG: hypothetical protein Q8Q25_02330 [bacterium]|nr:hypothetical protein [bacterium]
MKYISHIIILLISLSSSCHAVSNDFSIKLEPQWKDLEQDPHKEKRFGGKLILAGSISFKKKSKETLCINKLHLQWHGPQMDNLVASLYKKNLDKEFIPIEDSLICDGIWHKKEQRLLLNFDQKCPLGPINVFYLVLSIPKSLERTIKHGSFTIINHCLPYQLHPCLEDMTLSLSFSALTNPSTNTAR